MAKRNWEAIQRGRKARYLMRCIETMGVPHKRVAEAIGVSTRRIRNLTNACPQFEVLHEIGAFIQEETQRQLES